MAYFDEVKQQLAGWTPRHATWALLNLDRQLALYHAKSGAVFTDQEKAEIQRLLRQVIANRLKIP